MAKQVVKTLLFDDSVLGFVLDIFDKEIDEQGYIVEKISHQRILTPEGIEVKAEEFAGFVPGSEIVLTKDLPSLLQYSK
jgi:hypothetical protein